MVCGSIPSGKALRRDGARVGDVIYVSGPLGGWKHKKHVEPRIEQGRKLLGKATAAMDLSDGLSLDLHRLCAASNVAAVIDRVPVLRGSTEERALHGGEDYELLFTLPEGATAPRGVTRIGRIVRGVAGQIYFRGRVLDARGFDHFRKDS
jgi:thiamine-monophosphate kinase